MSSTILRGTFKGYVYVLRSNAISSEPGQTLQVLFRNRSFVADALQGLVAFQHPENELNAHMDLRVS